MVLNLNSELIDFKIKSIQLQINKNAFLETELSDFNIKLPSEKDRFTDRNDRRKKNVSAIPKSIESILLKKISSINPSFDNAFKYYDKDIRELAEDPAINEKIKNMDDYSSSEFLLGLKKKQRMNEYWQSRIRKDFTKLDKDSEDANRVQINKPYNSNLK